MKDLNYRMEKAINIRLSNSAKKNIRDKAQRCGIGKSKLIRIAVEIVKDDDITEYLLNKIRNK